MDWFDESFLLTFLITIFFDLDPEGDLDFEPAFTDFLMTMCFSRWERGEETRL